MILKDIFAYRSLPAVKEGELATLPGQPYLLYPEPVRLLDIINIMGRFSSFDEAAVSIRWRLQPLGASD
jgi:hypothetical protein